MKKLFSVALLAGSLTAQAQWSTDSISLARSLPAGASIGNKVLIAGGVPATDIVDIYDNSTGSWSTHQMSAPKFYPITRTIGSKVFVFSTTCFSNSPDNCRNIDVYDDSNGSWSFETPPAQYAALSNNDMEASGQNLVFFGRDSSYHISILTLNTVTHGWSHDTVPIAVIPDRFSVWQDEVIWTTYNHPLAEPAVLVRYNMTSRTMSYDTLPAMIYDPELYTAGDKTLLISGYFPGTNYTMNSLLYFDHLTGTFNTNMLAGYPARPKILRYGNKVLFAGGNTYNGFTSAHSSQLGVYDMNLDSMYTFYLPQPRGGIALTANCGRFYAAGGYGMTLGIYDVIDIIDTTGMTWSQDHLALARYNMAAAAVPQKTVFAGGSLTTMGPDTKHADMHKNCLTTAVPEAEEETGIRLYPNPASGAFRIDFGSPQEASSYQLFDVNGKIIRSGSVAAASHLIDAEGLAPGLYYLSVMRGRERIFGRKIIIDN